ncbi:MAG: hypothetical protein MUE60_11580 [Candidatus Eisenbacteria bacterium]|nr:hypothetical protein [Candidatus Eisenbacteria bacterium]
MTSVNLILSVPQGFVVATSLGIDGLARHLSPGSGKYFMGRSLFLDLAVEGTAPTVTPARPWLLRRLALRPRPLSPTTASRARPSAPMPAVSW